VRCPRARGINHWGGRVTGEYTLGVFFTSSLSFLFC
jgi:hypothetical protein